jgi:ferredoxin
MGHHVNPARGYTLLQQRLDRNVTGAPASPVFTRILQMLFTPEEAELARHVPSRPTSVDTLAKRLSLPADELAARLTEMAERGCMLDLTHEGRRYFMLPPVVIGFFEFTFMRTRDEATLAELARLFDRYMHDDDRFKRSVFEGQTQVGRSLVHEEALPDGLADHVEVLDWERASSIVESASMHAVSLCSCRHKEGHLGRDCGRELRTCLTLNGSVEPLVRSGNAERITAAEALAIIQQSKEAGMAQTADNVRQQVSYICNCCGCCCGMMSAAKTFELRHAIVTSNWIMTVRKTRCTGCGRCVKACPINAISLEKETTGDARRAWAARDEDLCLGCGVCYSACRSGAIAMRPRPRRVFTPEDVFDKTVAMAIERGKLAGLLFPERDTLRHRALGRVVESIEKSPPVKAALAIQPLRSAFLTAVVKGARRGAGAS